MIKISKNIEEFNMKLLYINACVGKESRTNRLADYLVSKLGCEVKEVELVKSNLQPMNEERLKERFGFIASKDFSSSMFDMAKDFALADILFRTAVPFFAVCTGYYISKRIIKGQMTNWDKTS